MYFSFCVISLFFFFSVFRSILLFVYLSVYFFLMPCLLFSEPYFELFPSFSFSIYLSTYLSIHQFIYSSIFLVPWCVLYSLILVFLPKASFTCFQFTKLDFISCIFCWYSCYLSLLSSLSPTFEYLFPFYQPFYIYNFFLLFLGSLSSLMSLTFDFLLPFNLSALFIFPAISYISLLFSISLF